MKRVPPEDYDLFLANLENSLADAHIPCLIAALVHLTGDTTLLDISPRPAYGPFRDEQGGLPREIQDRARAATLRAMRNLLADEPMPPPPDPATIRRMMNFVVGAEPPDRYLPLLSEQLALNGEDSHRPDWSNPQLKKAAASKHVVVIGAGVSGLLIALRLQQAGISFDIIEKNSDVGGTWLENTYPGCRVDTPNHLYSLSFEVNHEWPSYFSRQQVLLDYFQRLSSARALVRHIQFSTEATAAVFDEKTKRWSVTIERNNGTKDSVVADHVISAVGQLNEPSVPEIVGKEQFKGPSFHSARWRHDVELKRKRVGVIGTGASAFQFVPEIAADVEELVIFQRSAPWLVPTPDYHETVPEGARWLLEHVPFYERWFRFRLFWKMTEGSFNAVIADDDWRGPNNAIGKVSADIRQRLVDEIAKQCEGDQTLLDIVVPNYPFGGKRPLRDNGLWIKTLRRPNVRVVQDKIAEITDRAVKTTDGSVYDVDVLIYATGFKASNFLQRLDVRGRGGRRLHDLWGADARAYLGVSVPGFPNFFVMYGPNTNIAVSGSIIFMLECGASYIMKCMRLAAERNSPTIEIKESVHDAYNEEIDAANRKRAWGAPQSQSWYKSASGRVSQNWPHRLIDYWIATKAIAQDDFIFDEQTSSNQDSLRRSAASNER